MDRLFRPYHNVPIASVGWSTRTPPNANAGFGHAANPNIYGGSEYGGNEGTSVKGKLVNLIGATRTLMRSESMSELESVTNVEERGQGEQECGC